MHQAHVPSFISYRSQVIVGVNVLLFEVAGTFRCSVFSSVCIQSYEFIHVNTIQTVCVRTNKGLSWIRAVVLNRINCTREFRYF